MVALAQLRAFSARIGADPLLVQAAGGNTSIKIDGVMWIKASGTWLMHAASREIMAPVDLAALLEAAARDDPACETCEDFVRSDLNRSGLRPSIETMVHALMPQRVVAHVHCVNTIAWAIQENARAALKDRLSGFNWGYVPYARPGRPLARAISQVLRPGVDVLVLENHGLVVAADSVPDTEFLLRQVVASLARPVRPVLPADLDSLAKHADGDIHAPARDAETHALATDPVAQVRAYAHVFYPDHVVFVGTGVATAPGKGPAYVVPGKGVLVRKDARPAVEPMLRCLADVMRRIMPDDRLRALPAEDIAALTNWETEKIPADAQALMSHSCSGAVWNRQVRLGPAITFR
jgi:rhamnose utilization protein RhaD (predicted bifunctional aldolase and dehydrogenase)